jgi:D-glycero-D-manno-heptose 1,7-bisphosphate phosphatase
LRTIVVTNQRGIALGRYTKEDVDSIHAKLQDLLAAQGAHVDAFFVCPHDRGQCNCRKPLPGLFEQARAQYPGISAGTSVMIGDSVADMEFGKHLGMRAILIGDKSDERAPNAEKARRVADLRCSSLRKAVNTILGFK